MLLCFPSISKSEGLPVTSISSTKSNDALVRYNEIKAMDKSKMSPAEKRHLRKELRTMKTQSVGGGGVYISVGALLIIIILILIL
jgi:hypothetical protein